MTRDQFRSLFTGGHLGDQGDYKQRLNTLADMLYDGCAPEEITASRTLTAADTNKVFLIGTDALVVTLPATELGLKYTFINSGAAGNNIITISPNASDKIMGVFTLAASVVTAAGVDDKDIVNTKSSSTKGDRVTLVADGSAGWYIVESAGIWAVES